MGSNAAETHPVSLPLGKESKRRQKDGHYIHVDPAIRVHSSKADIYAPLRPGTDITFLGGMIECIIENKKYFFDYVINYTNASYIVGAKYD